MKENRPRRHGFSSSPGLKDELSLEEDSTLKEILNCLFPPELWETMKTQIILYAQQHLPNPSSYESLELQRYVALRLLVGIQPRPTYRFYWSENPIVNSPIFHETMIKDCYDLLMFIDILQSFITEVFTLERKVTVDELLWAYRGRHYAVQYNPSKSAHSV